MLMKPSQIEDQHIWEQELQRRLQKLEAEQRATAEAEQRRLKDLSLDALPEVRTGSVHAEHGRWN